MEQKTVKKKYVAPKVKEHGVVRELTQAGSGGGMSMSMGMSMGMGM